MTLKEISKHVVIMKIAKASLLGGVDKITAVKDPLRLPRLAIAEVGEIGRALDMPNSEQRDNEVSLEAMDIIFFWLAYLINIYRLEETKYTPSSRNNPAKKSNFLEVIAQTLGDVSIETSALNQQKVRAEINWLLTAMIETFPELGIQTLRATEDTVDKVLGNRDPRFFSTVDRFDPSSSEGVLILDSIYQTGISKNFVWSLLASQKNQKLAGQKQASQFIRIKLNPEEIMMKFIFVESMQRLMRDHLGRTLNRKDWDLVRSYAVLWRNPEIIDVLKNDLPLIFGTNLAEDTRLLSADKSRLRSDEKSIGERNPNGRLDFRTPTQNFSFNQQYIQ
jgi:hypothetical protein